MFMAQAAASKASTWESFCEMRVFSGTAGVTAAISGAGRLQHLLKLLPETRSSTGFLLG